MGRTNLVVNCFQITTLVEDSQGAFNDFAYDVSCELLSDYYFSRRFTGRAANDKGVALL